MKTDRELLSEFLRSNDDTCFEEIADRHKQMVYGVCMRILGNTHDAEDACQAVFIVLFKKADSVRKKKHVAAWLHTVARNTSYDILRKRKSEERRKQLKPKCEPGTQSAHRHGEIKGILDRELGRLPVRYRDVITLRYLEGKSKKETAALTGLPEGTVGTYASRGLKRLKRRISKAAAIPGVVVLEPLLEAERAVSVPSGIAEAVRSVCTGGMSASNTVSYSIAEAAMRSMIMMKITKAAAVIFAVIAFTAGSVFVTVQLRAEEKAAGTAGTSEGKAEETADTVSVPAAPVPNPFKGRRKRAEVYEFEVKPAVKKQGSAYLITFTSKAACDATVTVVDEKGKTVRHIASGVLGANAPAPFSQGSLSQKLVWDGKDDRGRPVDASKCTVRVGLGLQPKLAGFLGWSESNVIGVQGIAVDGKGRLIVLGGRARHPSGNFSPTILLFDGKGKYLRQLYPSNPMIPPERATMMRLRKGPDGRPTIRLGRSHFQYTICDPEFLSEGTQSQSPAVTPDGRFVFVSENARKKPRMMFFVDVRDGATPPGSKVSLGGMDDGPMHMAVSPDGTWIYFSAPYNMNRRRSAHAVYRTSVKKPGKRHLFAGKPGKAGKDNQSLNTPFDLACDGQGNVYVADYKNNRVQVFDPKGAYLRTIPVAKPVVLTVNPKSGDVYVGGDHGRGSGQTVRIERIGGSDKQERTVIAKAIRSPHRYPCMAGDFSSDIPVIWLATGQRAVHRYEDRSGKLVKTSGNVCSGAPGWGGWTADSWHGEIVADPRRDVLYVRDGRWLRVVTKNGRVVKRLGEEHRRRKHSDLPVISQIVNAPDGMLVMRLSNTGSFLTRYNPDTEKFIGFPDLPKQDKFGYRKTKYPGISIPNDASSRGWADQMGVAPNGDIYVPSGGVTGSDYAALRKAGLEYPHKTKKRFQTAHSANILKVFSKKGKLKCLSALPGMMHTQGIRIGRRGEVYAVMPCKPVGSRKSGGTLIKFNSRFDSFPVGRIEGSWGSPVKGKVTHLWHYYVAHKKTHIENVAWDYQGVMPVRFSGCQCPHSLFSIDGFERVFLPAAHKCAVDILDANGNMILSVGTYGNRDCRGEDSPVIDPKTGELRPRRENDPDDLKSPLAEWGITFMHPNYTTVDNGALYVNDMGNARIVRAVLDYHAEESVRLP